MKGSAKCLNETLVLVEFLAIQVMKNGVCQFVIKGASGGCRRGVKASAWSLNADGLPSLVKLTNMALAVCLIEISIGAYRVDMSAEHEARGDDRLSDGYCRGVCGHIGFGFGVAAN